MVETEREGGAAHAELFDYEIGQEKMFKGTYYLEHVILSLSLVYFSSSLLLAF